VSSFFGEGIVSEQATGKRVGYWVGRESSNILAPEKEKPKKGPNERDGWSG